MVQFKNFIFSLFPARYKLDDSYKNGLGQGLLERYLMSIGEELDKEVVPYMEGYLDQIDPRICDEKFLAHISDSLGQPPDIYLTPALYRNTLAYALALYKIKGTVESYNLFFNLLGLNITLIEYPAVDYSYDLFNYDEGSYDMSCYNCSYYDIVMAHISDDCTVPQITSIPPSVLNIILVIIEFLQPINALLNALIQGAAICEEVELCCEQSIIFNVQERLRYDEVSYDEFLFDDTILISSQTKAYDCSGTPVVQGIGVMVIETDFIIS